MQNIAAKKAPPTKARRCRNASSTHLFEPLLDGYRRRRGTPLELLEARILMAVHSRLINRAISLPGEKDRFSFALSSPPKLFLSSPPPRTSTPNLALHRPAG